MAFVVTSTLPNGKGRTNHMIRDVADKVEALTKFGKEHPNRVNTVVSVSAYG